MPIALGLTVVVALISALPQVAGLAALAVAPPVSIFFRVSAQVVLFLPLLLVFITGYTKKRGRYASFVTQLVFLGCAVAYAHFPEPFFDYIWDVFLIETLYVYLSAEALRQIPALEKYSPWPLRILLFKLMFCMGVVKFFHGMPEWQNGTALKYFWANQPMPGYLAWHFSHAPDWLQRTMAFFVFLVEVPGPFLIFLGKRPRLVFFFLNLLFQAGIFISGNYGFFNILTVAVGFSLWDFPPRKNLESAVGTALEVPRKNFLIDKIHAVSLRLTLVLFAGWLATGVWYILKTIAPGKNYLHETSWVFLNNEEQAAMFSPVRGLIQFYAAAKASNPYALFGIIPKYRMEIAIEGSDDGTQWRKYRFAVRPDSLNAAPVWYAPHHRRLDHQMYYESFRIREPQMHAKHSFFLGVRWMPGFLKNIFNGNLQVLKLLQENPFVEKPPLLLRFQYRYFQFTTPLEKSQTGNYWKTIEPHPGQFDDRPFDKDRLPSL
jgi:hypothetical protein